MTHGVFGDEPCANRMDKPLLQKRGGTLLAVLCRHILCYHSPSVPFVLCGRNDVLVSMVGLRSVYLVSRRNGGMDVTTFSSPPAPGVAGYILDVGRLWLLAPWRLTAYNALARNACHAPGGML